MCPWTRERRDLNLDICSIARPDERAANSQGSQQYQLTSGSCTLNPSVVHSTGPAVQVTIAMDGWHCQPGLKVLVSAKCRGSDIRKPVEINAALKKGTAVWIVSCRLILGIPLFVSPVIGTMIFSQDAHGRVGSASPLHSIAVDAMVA